MISSLFCPQLVRDLRHAERERRLAEQDVAAQPLPTLVAVHESPVEIVPAVTSPLERAEAEWQLVVVEPPGPHWQRIRDYIHLGLGWSSQSWPYHRDGDFAWCGAFAAWCFLPQLAAAVRYKHWASTYRLWRWISGTARHLRPDEIRAGDVAVVGHEGSRAWGAHVTICRGVQAGEILTYEGNALGQVGDGSTAEGVIKRSRPLPHRILPAREYQVMYGVRPLDQDRET